MSYYRIKPVTRVNKKRPQKTYYYLYEVESYRKGKKVKQKTKRLIGRYTTLKKLKDEDYPVLRVIKRFNQKKEVIVKDIIAFNLKNYGFKQKQPGLFALGGIIADLNRLRVYDQYSGRNIYINVNERFFGTETLRRMFKHKISRWEDIIGFYRKVVDSGLLNFTEKDALKTENLGLDEKQIELKKLIEVMEAAIEGKNKKKSISNNQQIMLLLLKKFPNYDKFMETHREGPKEMSFEDFRQKVGY